MKLTPTAIPDVVVIEPALFSDERGWFMESFNQQRFTDALKELRLPLPEPFVQDNHSCSRKGVLRGLHYQLPPHAQGKLVRVVHGVAFDVCVDIRASSPTCGRWVGIELSAANRRQLWVPEGFAHGFVALEDDTHFLYKTTAYYVPQSERSVLWCDEQLGIRWPEVDAPFVVAAKDAGAPSWGSLKPVDIFG